MRESVIVSAVRTPTGKFLGSLKDFTAPQLGAIAVREAVRRAGIDPAAVDECIMGNVVTAGEGQNPARQAALNGGLPDHVAALTINKVCGSGLKAVMLAAQGIATGDIDVAVAGGMESMSNTPYLLPRVREGLRMGNGTLVDSMIHDGLWCAFEQCHMGMSGEHVAEHFKVGREEQDRYAAESHRKAAQATREGWFKDEIVPVEIPQKKGRADRLRSRRSDPRRHDARDARRPEAGVQEGRQRHRRQRARRQRRRRRGRRDGAPTRRRRSASRRWRASSARRPAAWPPKLVLMTPVEAVRKVAKKAGWDLKDVDLFEINEAFSVQMVAVHARARHRPGEGERPRRRRRARPSDRRERRARPDDAALRAAAPRTASAASRRSASAAATASRWRSNVCSFRLHAETALRQRPG